MENEIIVGMGRLVVVDQPAILTGLGLGSCIGLMLYDEQTKVCGFAHIMLPDSSKSRFCEVERSSLVAENESIVLTTLKEALSKSGYDIKAVTEDGNLAVEKFKEINPYLTTLNSKIPPGTAMQVLDEIMKVNRAANVIVTDTSNAENYIGLLSKGAFDVIPHPCTRKKIEETLDLVNSSRFLRFADVAIDKMIERMVVTGADASRIKAKMVGGAHMFSHSQVEIRNIGSENEAKVTEILRNKKIRVHGKVVGGDIGRTVRFNTENFSAKVTSRNGEEDI